MTTKPKSPAKKSTVDRKGVGDKGGRPRKYKTVEAFDDAVDVYVALCRADDTPVTWTGLALALGFSSREAIDEYQNYDGFSDSVKRAKLIVQNAYEMRLAGNSPTGAIFALKNFGWRDNQSLDLTTNGKDLKPTVIQLVALE